MELSGVSYGLLGFGFGAGTNEIFGCNSRQTKYTRFYLLCSMLSCSGASLIVGAVHGPTRHDILTSDIM
jgi:hypothetical protein